MDAPGLDPALGEIRARARDADWTRVRTFSDHAVVRDTLEGALLVSEAELRQGDTAAARERLARVVQEAGRRRDGAARRRAANMLGAAYFELGEFAAAEAAFETALADATREHDDLTAARATNNLGMIANLRGRHDAALALYRVALPAYQRLGFPSGLGETSHNIAITLRDLGQYEEADGYERRAMEYAAEAGNRRLHAMARAGRAEVAQRQDESVGAAAEAGRAATEFAGLGDGVSEADSLRVLALARASLGQLDLAATAIDRAIALAEAHEAPLIKAESLWGRAVVRLGAGDRDQAASDVAAADALLLTLGAEPERARLQAWRTSVGL